jgi:hypothetical protein
MHTPTIPESEASEIAQNARSKSHDKSSANEAQPTKPVPEQTVAPPEAAQRDSRLTEAMSQWAQSRM